MYSKTKLCIVICCLLSINIKANVSLPAILSNQMVIQRNHTINLWGWATPGEHIKVSFNHKNKNTVTDSKGNWSVNYPAMQAGGPYTLEVFGVNHLAINNILIGDVWFCSGQSNMVLPMERVKERYPDEYANDDYPQIRNFFIPTVADVNKEHDDLPASTWKAAIKNNLTDFGAASYFFAKKIYLKYHIPIGIINSSVGGTPIEAWISKYGLHDFAQIQKRINDLQDTAYFNNTFLKTSNRPHNIGKNEEDEGQRQKWFDTAYVATGWHKFWLPGYWADQGVKGLNGVVWFLKEIDLPASISGKQAKLLLGRIVDADQTYVNGKLVGNITYQYPPRRYEIPAGIFKAGKNIIVVKITNTSGKGGFVPDKPYKLQIGGQTIDLRGDWLYKVGQVYKPAINVGLPVFNAQNEPTGLYNTMVKPLINYPVKGFLWYQGEANTSRPVEYQALLTALIKDWRSKWNNEALPFIYAQLPNFMEVQYLPSESQWAQLRESQLKTLSVNNTAMAVTIDAGEWNDIHPLDKKDVGERLALAAEKIAYGDKNLVAWGPLYQSAKVTGNKIEVTFSSARNGLMAKDDTELHYFAIAGADKKYVWAKAKINGNVVTVWSDEVDHPMYVRYAWADNPEGANLYNLEGLPASPFTTDSQ